MPKTAVARTCSHTAGLNEPMRGTATLPECGPAAVASVPVTSSAAHAAATSTATNRTYRGTGSPRIPHASSATSTPSRSTASASRKGEPTSQGFRLWSTVILPSGASAAVPRNAAPATQRTHLGAPGVSSATIHVASVTKTATPETILFENSTNEWKPFFGTNEPAVQPGQSRQPRPESVRRTEAPLATMTKSQTTFASATPLNVRTETVSPRSRGTEDSTTRSL